MVKWSKSQTAKFPNGQIAKGIMAATEAASGEVTFVMKKPGLEEE
jgi:hypothetical protein